MFKIYNTLSRKIEVFKPGNDPLVSLYSCGPTVYDYQHIGHMRRYVGDDILIRILRANGFDVTHAMNITDVGHLVSDSDEGEDKMEKGARKFGLSVWDIALKFEKQFFDSIDSLHIFRPDILMHATDYIDEQIGLIEVLEKKGFTYKIDDGIYFDTSKFPGYFTLSKQNPEELKKGARVEFAVGKKNISDFALWKFSLPTAPKRQMEWESPWGKGFPGWHIECSAMSMDALGETIDIHTGGIDHIAIHHTNEIAQSECATGKKFVNYWVHHNFLTVDHTKMSKSLGNTYTVQDILKKGYEPLALRYLYLQTHYRQEMNFTWESLDAAQTAYKKLIHDVQAWDTFGEKDNEYYQRFLDALNDDMNTAKALSVVWELVKSSLPSGSKHATILEMDEVLGLSLFEKALEEKKEEVVPQEVQTLVKERTAFRVQGDFEAADELRRKAEDLGFILNDTAQGTVIEKKK